MKGVLLALLTAMVSLSWIVPDPSDGWMIDYEEAFIKAKKENKHVLINFTGSDWCGWCKKLDREVFSQPAFKEYANRNLVLLKLDFPRSIPQSNEVKMKNQELSKQFGVRGFPTILIANYSQGVVLRTGYQTGGPEKYVKDIDRAIN